MLRYKYDPVYAGAPPVPMIKEGIKELLQSHGHFLVEMPNEYEMILLFIDGSALVLSQLDAYAKPLREDVDITFFREWGAEDTGP